LKADAKSHDDGHLNCVMVGKTTIVAFGYLARQCKSDCRNLLSTLAALTRQSHPEGLAAI
jgi:hypothetical protein